MLEFRDRAQVESAKPWVTDTNELGICVTTLNSFSLWLDRDDKSLTPSITQNGFWESWITSWFTHNVFKDDTVLDIGANCGYYTMLFEKLVGPRGKVIAYECNPRYTALLNQTRITNNARFVIREFAVSDSIDFATLHTPSDLHGSSSIVADWVKDDRYIDTEIIVNTTTLDYDYEIDVFDMPDVVKMDVEGAEELVWNGGHRLWNTYFPPVVVMEYTPDAYSKEFTTGLFDYGKVTRINFAGREEDITPEHLFNLTDWDMIVLRKR